MYSADDLMEVFRRRPFPTTVVHLSSGETFAVTHPEQVMVTEDDGVIITTPSDKPGRVRWRLVGLAHVQSVEVTEAI